MRLILVTAVLLTLTACGSSDPRRMIPTPQANLIEPCKKIKGFERDDRLVLDAANLLLDYHECAKKHEALASMFD